MKLTNKLLSALLACASLFAAGQPALADDSEVFTNSAFLATGVRPNVLFIIDTSGSMDTVVNTYDPTQDYSASAVCSDPNRVYWRDTNTSVPPDCRTSNQWVSTVNNRCYAGANGMRNAGWWNGRSQMLITGSNPTYWGNFVAGIDRKLECSSDNNVHGDLPGTTAPGGENKYARNGTGTADANRWGNSGSSNLVSWSTRPRYSLYSTNYINWYYGAGGSTPRTRLQTVRDVAKSLIDSLEGVNLGIMRYDQNAQGGMVRYPVSELTTASRTAMKAELDSYVADGYTPLSETLYEAHQYFAAGNVDYGNNSYMGGVLRRSVAASRVGGLITNNTYDSPADYSCQNNFIVYLTDGLPTQDNDADTKIQNLPNFAADGGGACPAQIDDPDPSWPTAGRCLENLARYMHNHDMRPDVLGQQSTTTYVVGFGDDIATSEQFLQDVAAAGGGQAFTQTDAAGLTAALEQIFDQVREGADTTFVSPAVAVNAFNRTQNLNQLFVSVFAPSQKKHWPGNLKKYRMLNGEIYGVSSTTPAVDPVTGFFRDSTKALNTPTSDPADGMLAKNGGSAARLPTWIEGVAGERRLFTHLGIASDLTSVSNAVKVSNVALTDAMVGAADATERQTIIEFARGRDANDFNENGDFAELRKQMGDPMHAKPAIVIYGGTAAAPVGTVFVTTNDGFLHAFDMDSGDELWAFIPREFLARQADLFDNPPMTAGRDYGLDGDVRVFKYDVDQDGSVEPADGDKVYLFFGAGRGGRALYSIDVTSRLSPQFRWKKTNADAGFTRLGYTWSTPVISRVNISGAPQTGQKYVLIFGGGYDPGQEAYPYSTDSMGNVIYIVDLETGDRLWSASSASTNYNNTEMTHGFPSAISVIDLDQDRFADRLYAADVGGRIWRFDLTNGNTVANFATGGVLANLGGAQVMAASGSVPLASNRRFYNAPDVAPILSRGSRPFINIAIGSGYRGHPLETTTRDRFYSVRDYDVFNKRTTASYLATGAITTDTDLVDITDNITTPVADGARGWKIEFRTPAWRGEKVIADSVTIGGAIFFTTFQPLAPDPTQPCLARVQNRIYGMLATNGKPYARWSESGTGALTINDRSADLASGGIAPSLNVFRDPIGSWTAGGSSSSTSSGSSTSSSTSSTSSSGGPIITDEDSDYGRNNWTAGGGSGSSGSGSGSGSSGGSGGGGPGAQCTVGVEQLGNCVNFGDVTPSFWEHR